MAEATDARLEDFDEDGESEHGTSAEYTDPWCDICYDKTGSMVKVYAFCPECNNFMCNSCTENHRLFPVLKKHKILKEGKIPKSQSNKPVKYPNCSVHVGNSTDQYCIDHSEMVCSECSKHSHQSCESLPVSYIYKNIGSTDIQQFGNVIDILKQNVLATKSELECNASDIDNQKEELITQAQAEHDKLVSNAEKLFEDTVSMISDECEHRKRCIAEQLLTLENMVHSLDQTTSDIGKNNLSNLIKIYLLKCNKLLKQSESTKSLIHVMLSTMFN